MEHCPVRFNLKGQPDLTMPIARKEWDFGGGDCPPLMRPAAFGFSRFDLR
jgi:hypothetical protein